ncbi:MAG TPA: BadF/BadG/BcrA/BcrD ATPase family protein [Terriglobia bacterium]
MKARITLKTKMLLSRRRDGPLHRGLLYLGVDGGGTRTTAWVADGRGRVLGRAVAGPSNPVKVGLPAAEREILAAARQASAKAGRSKLEAVCLGLAGGDRPEVARPLAAWLRKRLPARFHLVTTDAALALEAAGRSPGVVVIAGTGSIACAHDAQGRMIRAGGWGSTFDDAGSGFDLGRQAVRAALRAFDGRGPRTRLGKAITGALGIGEITEIAGLGLATCEIAALAPPVVTAAGSGDVVARSILDGAGRDLAELALALVRRLGSGDEAIRVVCAGGLFQASTALRRSFARHLRGQVPRVRVSTLRHEPIEGALALARREAQVAIDKLECSAEPIPPKAFRRDIITRKRRKA